MMKSLLAANRSEKDSFRIPHSVQQSIPIRRIYTDGIWQVGQKYSKTWRFSDINYAASSLDDRRSIFRSYGAVLNSLPTDATAKITIINRRLNPVDFQRTMLMPECSDGLDYYRGEYNQIILDKAAESNNLVQEKYITLSIGLRKIEQTRAYFRRVDTNLSASFGRLDSGAYAISCADRLRLLHDFFRPGEEASFRFDLSANIKRSIDFRDLICPDGLQFRAGYFEMGGKFGRVLFMRDYASFISDEMIKDLSDFSRNLLLFNQAATDRAELSKLLHISDTQLSYITNAEAGHGLLRMGGSIVPFVNTIPRNTELYKLMTTTPGEAL